CSPIKAPKHTNKVNCRLINYSAKPLSVSELTPSLLKTLSVAERHVIASAASRPEPPCRQVSASPPCGRQAQREAHAIGNTQAVRTPACGGGTGERTGDRRSESSG